MMALGREQSRMKLGPHASRVTVRCARRVPIFSQRLPFRLGKKGLPDSRKGGARVDATERSRHQLLGIRRHGCE